MSNKLERNDSGIGMLDLSEWRCT